MASTLTVLALVLLVLNFIFLFLLWRRTFSVSFITALTELRNGQDRQERVFQDELARNRMEGTSAARDQRQELAKSIQVLSETVFEQMSRFGQSQAVQLDTFAKQLRDISDVVDTRLNSSRQSTDLLLRAVTEEIRRLQTDFRTEMTGAVDNMAVRLDTRVGEGMHTQVKQFEATSLSVTQALSASTENTSSSIERLRSSVETKLVEIQNDNSSKLESIRANVEHKLTDATQSLTTAIDALSRRTGESADNLRSSVENRLLSIQSDNASKLEEVRKTVDDKLHATLEQRLGDSFRIVSERLEQVHEGLGEMKTLASGVGDLKKVLMNIRARGNWGEVQVGTLLEQLLSPSQYSTNVNTNPQSNERVEYAIKLPGKDSDGNPVWLPIDSKFPYADYERLIDAAERGDATGIGVFSAALEENVCLEARKIRDKYVNPPHTTDFAILFLPTEGLFAEILRRPGIYERTLKERIILAGPTTLAALLSSLEMGFRTVAIEKRSAEVWELLGAVKTEFAKFGNALASVEKKLTEASNRLGDVRTRQRVLSRRLKDVQELPATDSERLLQLPPITIAAAAEDDQSSIHESINRNVPPPETTQS